MLTNITINRSYSIGSTSQLRSIVLYMIAMLIWMLAVASVLPVYTTSQLDEGILCVFFFALGKLGYGEVFSSFDEKRPA